MTATPREDARMMERELTLSDFIAMLRRRWVLIAVFAAIGAPLAYGISRFLPPKYTSQTLVLVERPAVSPNYVAQVDTTSIGERLASMKPQILSRTRLEPIIRQYGLYSEEIDRVSMDLLVAQLQSAIEVNPVAPMAGTESGSLPGFTVNVTLSDPRMAQQVCTAITSMFIEENLRKSQQHSEVTTEFLAQQLDEAKRDLDDQDKKLAAFEMRYMGTTPEDAQMNFQILMGLTSQLSSTTEALARAQQDKSYKESELAQQLAAWQGAQTGRNPETLEQQLAALQTKLTNLEARYTDNYPDVIKTKSDIAALENKIAADNAQPEATQADNSTGSMGEPAQIKQLRKEIYATDQEIVAKTKEQQKVKDQIKVYQGRVESTPGIEQQYKELTRGYQTALETYNSLLRKKEDADMAKELQQQQAGEQFRVLDPANLPTEPSFPKRPRFALLGFAGGLGLGVGLALLLGLRDSSLRSERDVEIALRLPVLALVPSIEVAEGKRPLKLTDGSPASSGARQTLRA
jgi:polysaccharide chain length determinant protein (PEP-CTERM system associated)